MLNTYVGNEHTLKANIERRIQSMNMRDKIFRVVVPMEPDLEFKDGRLATPVFPGYVLIKMNWSDQSWELVRRPPASRVSSARQIRFKACSVDRQRG